MSDVIRMMKERRSIRAYKPEMVSEDLINQVMEAGLYAASAMGTQNTKIIAITKKEVRDQLSKLNASIMGQSEDFDPFYGAPVVLIVLGKKDWPMRVYDGSLVMGNMMLAAESLGLGSCWIHRAKEEFEGEAGKTILKYLGIDGEWEGIGHCILGYTDGEKAAAAPRQENRTYYIR